MRLVLEILGLIFLVIVLTIVTVFLLVRWKIRRLMRQVGKSFEGMFGAFNQPATIHLEPSSSVEWENPEAVEDLARPLKNLGYHDAGRFEVEEVPGLCLWAFVNPSEAAYAVVYEHPAAGAWLDFVTRYQDGTGITYANTEHGSELDHMPGREKVYLPDLDTEPLHARFLDGRPDRPRKCVSATDFVAVFEQAYAEEMAWRNARGGPTDREILAIATRSGREMSDADLDELRINMARQAMEGLDESLRDRFLDKTTMRAGEWERIRDAILFVHDGLTPDMVAERVEEWYDDEEVESLWDDARRDYPGPAPVRGVQRRTAGRPAIREDRRRRPSSVGGRLPGPGPLSRGE